MGPIPLGGMGGQLGVGELAGGIDKGELIVGQIEIHKYSMYIKQVPRFRGCLDPRSRSWILGASS
ncbi:hypothetical protein GCM10025772_26700 [Ferrimonas gelatinilytica]|uniref:Uncharacterized protein n=1 Tax=Ferrimonas gelatinilytica TaxID=1255257 RepID=A0ABP9SEI4_9GAMM